MKDYLTRETDPTLPQMRWLVLIMWAVTFSIIVSFFVKTQPILKPIYYLLNGAILNSDYIPGEIK